MIGSTGTDIAQITGTAAQAAAPAIGGAVAGATGLSTAMAASIVGAGIAAVTLAVVAFLNRKGPRQKVATTAMVNEVEPLLKRNVEEYLSGPRTVESQAVAKKNFLDVWQWLTSRAACGNPEMGNPGKACIADRDRGGKWDWWSYYYDPIANDTPVQPASAGSTAAEIVAALTGGQGSLDPQLLIGAALIAAVVLFS